MDDLKTLLAKKVITKKEPSKRKQNLIWEEADQYAKYVGVKTIWILKLYKDYGRKNVLAIKSWLKDCPRDEKRFYGLMVWKLKGGQYKTK